MTDSEGREKGWRRERGKGSKVAKDCWTPGKRRREERKIGKSTRGISNYKCNRKKGTLTKCKPLRRNRN